MAGEGGFNLTMGIHSQALTVHTFPHLTCDLQPLVDALKQSSCFLVIYGLVSCNRRDLCRRKCSENHQIECTYTVTEVICDIKLNEHHHRIVDVIGMHVSGVEPSAAVKLSSWGPPSQLYIYICL